MIHNSIFETRDTIQYFLYIFQDSLEIENENLKVRIVLYLLNVLKKLFTYFHFRMCQTQRLMSSWQSMLDWSTKIKK